MKRFFVYLLATRKDGPVYVGVTSDLLKRAFEHRTHAVPGFTSRYNVDRLVWFEAHDTAETAIAREKTHQAMAPRVEDRLDRREHPGMAQPL